jgi:thioredoxin-disulfide reductase
METQYDIVIVGGACAGLAAGTYAARRALKVLIVTKDIGGQIATTPTVENYPAIDLITGPDLSKQMMDQALKWGCELVYDEITTLKKEGEKDFTITGLKGTYKSKALIIAYGKTPRNLDVPGEEQYAGKGVSYCVTCDAPLFRNRTVVVVGGGNSAMEGALILAKVCQKVYLVHRRDQFRGEEVLLGQINAESKIELVLSSVTQEVLGDGKFVTGIRVANVNTKETRDITVDGIFVEIGFIVNTALIKDVVELDRMNQIVTNKRMETSTPGIFAAGDITDSPYKQAVISAGEGASAALTAYSYINDGRPAGVDWTAH